MNTTVPRFIMMMGIPGSGKSTIASWLAPGLDATIVSSDVIRVELYGKFMEGDYNTVFGLMESRTMAALAAGKNVIYDATNVTVWRRRSFLLKLPRDTEKICIWVDTRLNQALINNSRRTRHTPEYYIRCMAGKLEPPTKDEGWDAIYVVTY